MPYALNSDMIPWWDMTMRIFLAIVLGGLIGLNRELAHKPAGLKTHILVCMGSALVMLVSIELFLRFSTDRSGLDPGRIAAQVVSGIGFLGAGTIFHAQGGLVQGLTTAASIWAVAGIGLACGAGMYQLAAIATSMAVLALALINRLMPARDKSKDKSKT